MPIEIKHKITGAVNLLVSEKGKARSSDKHTGDTHTTTEVVASNDDTITSPTDKREKQ